MNTTTRITKTGWSSKQVSWEDVKRGKNEDGTLSSYGPNISDVRLLQDDRKPLYTVRPDNWNELLRVMDSKEILLAHERKTLHLKEFLENVGKFGNYTGLDTMDLSLDELDKKVYVRFQTVFLSKETKNFCTNVFNYQTSSVADPKNVLLLCTSQGVSVHQGKPSKQDLFYHNVKKNGEVTCHWLEASATKFSMDNLDKQQETEKEKRQAIQDKKATAQAIGIKDMGNRMNVQLLIQIPIKQKERTRGRGVTKYYDSMTLTAEPPLVYRSMTLTAQPPLGKSSLGGLRVAQPPLGKSTVARVSLGKQVNNVPYKFVVQDLVRSEDEHITVTVTTYYVVENGVPSESDIEKAISDLSRLYGDSATRLAKLV